MYSTPELWDQKRWVCEEGSVRRLRSESLVPEEGKGLSTGTYDKGDLDRYLEHSTENHLLLSHISALVKNTCTSISDSWSWGANGQLHALRSINIKFQWPYFLQYNTPMSWFISFSIKLFLWLYLLISHGKIKIINFNKSKAIPCCKLNSVFLEIHILASQPLRPQHPYLDHHSQHP